MMAIRIEKQELDQYGGEAGLQQRIQEYETALEAHKITVDEPAPPTDQLVERLVKHHDKIFEVYEAETADLSPAERLSLAEQVTQLETRIQALEAKVLV